MSEQIETRKILAKLLEATQLVDAGAVETACDVLIACLAESRMCVEQLQDQVAKLEAIISP